MPMGEISDPRRWSLSMVNCAEDHLSAPVLVLHQDRLRDPHLVGDVFPLAGETNDEINSCESCASVYADMFK